MYVCKCVCLHRLCWPSSCNPSITYRNHNVLASDTSCWTCPLCRLSQGSIASDDSVHEVTWPLHVVWFNPGAKRILHQVLRNALITTDGTKLHAPELLKENMLGRTSLDYRARGVAKRPAGAWSEKSYALMKRHGNILRLTLSLPKEFLREQLGLGGVTLSDLFRPSGCTDHTIHNCPRSPDTAQTMSSSKKSFFLIFQIS